MCLLFMFYFRIVIDIWRLFIAKTHSLVVNCVFLYIPFFVTIFHSAAFVTVAYGKFSIWCRLPMVWYQLQNHCTPRKVVAPSALWTRHLLGTWDTRKPFSHRKAIQWPTNSDFYQFVSWAQPPASVFGEYLLKKLYYSTKDISLLHSIHESLESIKRLRSQKDLDEELRALKSTSKVYNLTTLLKKRKQPTRDIPYILHDKVIYNEPATICELFSEWFANFSLETRIPGETAPLTSSSLGNIVSNVQA